MKKKVEIRLFLPEAILAFVKKCEKYDSDINVIDGSIIIDAKSIISVFSIPPGKILEVEILSEDINETSRFINDMESFTYKRGEKAC